MTKHNASDQSHHVRIYLMVFGALMVCTLLTVMVSWLHLPKRVGIPLGLLIAGFKASLVAAFFMHLKWEKKLIYGLLALTVFFTIVLFSLPMVDSATHRDRISPTAAIDLEAPETPH